MNKITNIINNIVKARWYIFATCVCVFLLAERNNALDNSVQNKQRFVPDHMYGISANSKGQVVAVGYHSTTFLSEDNGETWKRLSVDSKEVFRRAVITEEGVIIAVGHRGGIYRVDNNGKSEKVYMAETGYLRDVFVLDEGKLIAVGKNAGIYVSNDDGYTWSKKQITGYTGRDLPTLNGVSRIGSGIVAVGEFGTLLYSENGNSWFNINNDIEKSFTAVDSCFKCEFAIAIGLDGLIVQIFNKNGQIDTKEIKTTNRKHLFDIVFNEKDIFAVGDSVLLKLTKSGNKKLKLKTEHFDSEYAWVHGIAISSNNVIAVGTRGAMLTGKLHEFPNQYKNFSTIN